ncbi:16604_t:CDS:1, partial [Cetraspora pellucida]
VIAILSFAGFLYYNSSKKNNQEGHIATPGTMHYRNNEENYIVAP